ncbi:MAG: radical SAM protein [Coriobacteriia bacterium]|nr:radical SAM protein [Coriobacteriia bacterium]
MSVSWRPLGDTTFLITRQSRLPLLYAPLQDLVMEVNDAYVRCFQAALDGDAESARAIGVEPGMMEAFAVVSPKVRKKFDPSWPEAFEPTSVTLFLTHKCTLRCAYCYCEGGSGRDIDWPVLEASVLFALENAVRLGRELTVAFHGGDVGAVWPLFQRAIEFIEAAAAQAGVKVTMNTGTNGFYSASQAAYIAEHMHSATVSIDGLPEVHDRYRVTPGSGPSLETVLRSVRIFEENGLAYTIRMTVTAESLPLLAESVEYLCEHTKAQVIRAEPMYSRGRASVSELETPEPHAFVEAFREAGIVAQTRGRLLTYSGARPGGVVPAFCTYPSPTFGVTPDGDLSCCYEVLRPDDPLSGEFFYGHVEADGSAICVDRSRIAAIRNVAAQRRSACAECFCVFSCAGDCAAKAFDSGRLAGEMSSRCEITRALVLDMLEAALGGA